MFRIYSIREKLKTVLNPLLRNKKYLLTFLLVILALRLYAWDLPFGDKKSSLNMGKYKEPPVQDDSTLRVIQGTPVGKISLGDRDKEIYVVFNHPLVPIARLDRETKGVFTINPPVAGKYRWYGSRVCSFKPEKGWSPGTRYRVTVKSGLKALNAKTLKKDHSFQFRVIVQPLSVTHIAPYYGQTIDYDQKFTLNFNFPVRLADLYKTLSVLSEGNHCIYSLSYEPWRSAYNYGGSYEGEGGEYGTGQESEIRKEYHHRIVRITVKERFPRNSSISVRIKKTLRAENFNTRLSSDYSMNYKTHGPLKVQLVNSPRYYQDMWDYGFAFNNYVNGRDAALAIVFDPPVKPRYAFSEKTRNLYINSWSVQAGREYRVRFNPLKDIYGNDLAGEKEFTVHVPHYRPSFTLESSDGLIESEMRQVLPVYAANMPQLDVQIGHFDVSHLQKLLLSRIDYRKKYDLFTDLSLQSIKWDVGVKPTQAYRLGFDLKKYLSGDRKGWVALGVSGMVRDYNDREVFRHYNQMVQSTDLGMAVKESYEAAHIWVYSLTRGNPVKGVTVKQYDTSRLLASAETNEEGYCRISKGAKGMIHALYVASRGKNDRTYLTTAEHEVGMYGLCSTYHPQAAAPTLVGQIVFDRKLYRPGDKMMFKGILTIRQEGHLGPLSKTEVQAEIVDASGQVLDTLSLATTKQGGLWGEYTIKADASLGHYQVRIKYGSNPIQYVSDTFQVEEFRPVTFTVQIDGLKDVKSGSRLNPVISASYLFGAPMQSSPANYSLSRSKKYLEMENFSGYTFGDEDSWYYGGTDWSDAGYYTGSSGTLDAGGRFKVQIPINPMLTIEQTQLPAKKFRMGHAYNMKMEATVKDVDKKSVTKTAFFTVYPGNFLIGIKPANRYQSYKKNFEFDIVAVSNDGRRVEDKKVEIRVIKMTWKSIKTKGPGGSLQPKNTLVKSLEYTKKVTISSHPTRFHFKPKGAGEYTLTVQEEKGLAFSRVRFYGYGGGLSAWDFRDDDAVSLLPDKKQYKPGETARVLIQSPYKECKAIITLEREKILWQKTMNLTGTGEVVSVPIKAEYLPNVYLSVILIRPRVKMPEGIDAAARKVFVENDLGMPKFNAGIVKLAISNASRIAKLRINTDKKDYSPGETVNLVIQTEPNAELVIAVADRGVLDLINYSYDSPVGRFFGTWELGVRILENRRFLIKQYKFAMKGQSPGGDGSGMGNEGKGGFSMDSEDGARKDIRYTAYWNPNITADSSGKAEVSFKLPHNLTTFRLMAVASADGRYRELNREFKVRKALVIQKNLPRFIRPGDELRMGAVVINQTGLTEKFRFTLDSDLLTLEEKTRVVEIRAGEAKEITFPARLNLKKYAELKKKASGYKEGAIIQVAGVKGWLIVEPVNLDRFTQAGVKKSDVRDKLAFDFPVREQMPEEAFSIAGFSDGKAEEAIQIPERDKVLGDMGELNLTLASTALVGLDKAFRFYASNPYFCLEQRASAFLLRMTAGDLLTRFSFTPPGDKDYDFRSIEKIFLGEIEDFQNADGGFRFWKTAEANSDPYLTAYITQILIIADKKGYAVNSGVTDKAIRYLRSYVESPPRDGYSYVLETLSLINYLFALKGENNSALTKLLLKNEKSLSLRARAHLALSLAESEKLRYYTDNSDTRRLLEHLKNRMEITTRKVSFREENHGSYRRAFYASGSTLGTILRTFIRLDRDNPLIPQMVQFVLASHGSGVGLWHDSHSSGILALALHDYHQEYEKGGSAEGFRALINGKVLTEHAFKSKTLGLYSVQFPMPALYGFGEPGKTYPFSLIRSGSSGRLYYTATLSYFPILPKVEPRDEGIEIRREMLDLAAVSRQFPQGKERSDDLERGNLYLFRLTLINPKPYFNLVISDPIPSNVEIVNLAFSTEKSSLGRFLVGRHRSGFWWENAVPNTEYRDDRVIITQNYIDAGIHEYVYLVRPTVKGKAQVPAASAKLMYEPEVFGRTGNRILSVH